MGRAVAAVAACCTLAAPSFAISEGGCLWSICEENPYTAMVEVAETSAVQSGVDTSWFCYSLAPRAPHGAPLEDGGELHVLRIDPALRRVTRVQDIELGGDALAVDAGEGEGTVSVTHRDGSTTRFVRNPDTGMLSPPD